MKFYRNALFVLFSVLFLSYIIPIKSAAAEEAPLSTHYVRFTGQGLNVYADPSLSGTPIAVLPDFTYVQVTLGPVDSCVRIKVSGTELEGYTDIRYLKRTDAIVCDYDTYTYEEMEKDIQQLQARYPGLLRVNTIGTTADKRNIYELVMGSENAPEHILIQAGMHAREYINPLLVMEQLENCLEYYNSGSFHGINYSELFSNAAIHIIPMVNPDGIAISQFGENALRSPELVQFLRACYQCDVITNRTKSSYEDYLKRWKANAHGVDINRNFPWGFASNNVMLPSFSGYAGQVPLSEPESSALASVTLKYNPTIVISYHSMGEIAYYDTAGSIYTQMHKDFSSYMLSFVPYKRMPAGKEAGGSYLDWIYSSNAPVCSITFETGNVECPLDASQYPKIWLQHYIVLPAAAEYAYTH